MVVVWKFLSYVRYVGEINGPKGIELRVVYKGCYNNV